MVREALKPLTSAPPEPLSNLKLPGTRNSGVSGMNGGRPPPTTLFGTLYSVLASWFGFRGICLAPAGPVTVREGPASKNWNGTCPTWKRIGAWQKGAEEGPVGTEGEHDAAGGRNGQVPIWGDG